jgi:predicted nucleic acid-binding protein
VTSPKIFQNPTPFEDAVAFLDALLATPGVQLAQLGPEWSRLRQLCLDKSLRGNDLPDAWLSATVVQLGEHLVTFDRDFRRLLTRSQYTLLVAGA